MNRFSTALLLASCATGLTGTALAAADDSDALALESAPEPTKGTAEPPFRFFVEGAVGRIAQRYGLPDLDTRRLSLDLAWSTPLSDRWRLTVSDRLDAIHPADPPTPTTLNSLREAFASWQGETGQQMAEFGRINLRNGPAYGYNPTDYFRDGALRAVTTVDPLSQRENRLGTVMARFQQLWAGGGLSLAVAPRLVNTPSNASFSLDLGATNAHSKGLASWSAQFSDKLSGQLLAYGEQGRGPQLGASVTALLSDAAVGFAEFSRGRDEDLFAATASSAPRRITRNRLALGATYTTPTRLALTAEYEYNGFAPDREAWDAGMSAGTDAYGRYLQAAQTRQDNATRHAWLFYATQKSLFLKSLDLTAMLRLNADDHSRLGWLELRYHWPRFDAALQWQATSGSAWSEYGLVPYRRSVQLLAAWYY